MDIAGLLQPALGFEGPHRDISKVEGFIPTWKAEAGK